MARTGPAADELLESNPALAFAVACGADLCAPDSSVRYRELQFLQAYHSQRRVLARLGFPPTERARRILRKVRPPAVSLASLGQLRLWLDDADVAERLAHVSHINRGVLAIVQNRTIMHLAPAALERIGREDADVAADYARRVARRHMAMYRVLYPQRCTLSLTPSHGIRVIGRRRQMLGLKAVDQVTMWPSLVQPG